MSFIREQVIRCPVVVFGVCSAASPDGTWLRVCRIIINDRQGVKIGNLAVGNIYPHAPLIFAAVVANLADLDSAVAYYHLA